jgi:archaellum component FlaC
MRAETVIRRDYGIPGGKRQAEILLNQLVNRINRKIGNEQFFMLDVDGNNIDIRPFLANAVSLFGGLDYDKILWFVLKNMSDTDVAGMRLQEIITREEVRLLSLGLAWPMDLHRRLLLLFALKKCKKAAAHITAYALGYLGFNEADIIGNTSQTGAKEFSTILVTWWLSKKNIKEGKERLLPYVVKLGKTLGETFEFYDKGMADIWMKYLSGGIDTDTFLTELDNLHRSRKGLSKDRDDRFIKSFVAGEMWTTYVDNREILAKANKIQCDSSKEPDVVYDYLLDILESLVVLEISRMKGIFSECCFNEEKVKDAAEEYQKVKQRACELEEELRKVRKELSKAKKEAEQSNSQANKLQYENNRLRAENNELKSKINSMVEPIKEQYEAQVQGLRAEVNKLTSELAVVSRKNGEYINKINELKDELSLCRLEYDELKDSYEDLKEMKLSMDAHINCSIPIEVVLNSVKDLRVAVIGGSQTLASNLRAMGLNRWKFYVADEVPSTSEIGVCDCIVIIVSYVPHSGIKSIRKYGKRVGIPIINFNGRNIEEICRAVYGEVVFDAQQGA